MSNKGKCNLHIINVNKNSSEQENEFIRKLFMAMLNSEKVELNENFKIFCNRLYDYFKNNKMPVLFNIINTELFFIRNGTNYYCNHSIKIFEKDLLQINISPQGNGIDLLEFRIETPGKGLGSLYMNAFNVVSKETGIVIFTVPKVPSLKNTRDKERLHNFYHKHGFKKLQDSEYWSNKVILGHSNLNL